MNTILVPTDFSNTAYNAARYGLLLAKQLGAGKLVLYNAYQTPVIGDAMASTVALIDFDTYQQVSKNGLEAQKEELEGLDIEGVEIDTLSVFNFLVGGIDDVCKDVEADLIVMGITGASGIEETFIGSNTISVAKHTKVPVIIVPANASFTSIKKVLLTCDFKDVSSSLPTDAIASFLKDSRAELHVLHVEKADKTHSNEAVFETVPLETLLGQFNPQYHFVSCGNFAEGVDSFAIANEIDIVIVLPKKHGILDSLFHKSHTKALAFHSHIPLVVIHD